MARLENYRLHDISGSNNNYRVDYSDFGNIRFMVERPDGSAGDLQVGDQVKFRQYLLGQEDQSTEFYLNYYGRDANGIFVGYGTPQYYFSPNVYPVDTVITMDAAPYPVCFLKGSKIVTDRGAIAIEDLLAGDLVQTQSGWGTVKWVGNRSYGPAALSTTDQKIAAAPVRIRANAIEPNVPSMDLFVSPWHHLVVDGYLVRANDLINGTTIVQETHVTSVDYYHVELEQFDVIMAHGIYSESWADGGNRSFFQNADVTALRPTDLKRRRASRPGFDHLVLRKGKKLEAIQKKVAERARRLSKQETTIAKAA